MRYLIALTVEQWAVTLAALKTTQRQFARLEGRAFTTEETKYRNEIDSAIKNIEAAIYLKETSK